MNWKQAIAYARGLGFEVTEYYYSNKTRDCVRVTMEGRLFDAKTVRLLNSYLKSYVDNLAKEITA